MYYFFQIVESTTIRHSFSIHPKQYLSYGLLALPLFVFFVISD